MKSILYVCVNYKNSNYTKKLINSLHAQSGIDSKFNLKCIVVDNSATLDKLESDKLKIYCEKQNRVKYLDPRDNLGYFGGLNFGLASEKVSDYDFVVIGNNDLEYHADFSENIFSLDVGDNVYSFCPDVITLDGVHQNPHVLRKMSFISKLKYDIYYSNYYVAKLTLIIKKLIPKKITTRNVAPCEIHMGIGACYVLTKNFLDVFNSLDFPFFLYGEEAFFSDQIHKVNGILVYEPSLRVDHAESASLSKVPRRTVYEYSRQGYDTYRGLL